MALLSAAWCPTAAGQCLSDQAIKIHAQDAKPDAQFGTAVATSGDRLVVGAPRDTLSGNIAGATYVYDRNAGGPNNWAFEAR